ncbi:MAG: photosystem II cytochrome c-550 [Xenococcaceae cyanobacterium]
MLKRLIWVVVATVFFAFQLNIGSAAALNLDEDIRTVQLNEQGDEIVLTNEQAQRGASLFNSTCTQCHLQGKTKTNPNIGLGLDELAGAEPRRDSIVALVDYLQHPTSYDGEEDLTLLHPNTERPDIYPEMRNFTEEDLTAIAGHLLIQPKLDSRWGGTIYN